MAPYALIAATLLGLATAQTPGSTPEVHPKLNTWKCTKAGGCKEQSTAIVVDSASHNIHQKGNSTLGCGNWGSGADPVACPDEETCAKNCIMEGIQDYSTMGVYTTGGELRLDMFNPSGGQASPRVYLLAEDEENYEMLQLTGNELAFDVDVSKLPCGMNGALYLSEMEADGGRSQLNPGGAAYGTGYCDAQCFVTPWINGVVSTSCLLPQYSCLLVPGKRQGSGCLLQRNGYLGGKRSLQPDRTSHMQYRWSLWLHRR